jgi:hypothetical protein
VTTGQVNGWSLPDFGPAPGQGEAIVEHLGGYNLPNFGSVSFSASSVNGSSLNNGGSKIPTSDGSMSTGGIGGSGNFTVSYVHC